MSVKDKQTNDLEKGIVVREATTVQEDPEKEAKKAKAVGIAKKALTVAGVAAVGVLGYLLGSNKNKKSYDYDDSDIIEGEIIDSDM